MNGCPNCHALQDEIRQLKRELGFEVDQSRLATVRVALGLTAQEGSVVMALYQAKGRVMSTPAIADLIPHPTGKDDYDLTFVNVVVCKVRKKLGKAFIENVWGAGYRLSNSARSTCDSLIGIPDGSAA